MRWAAGWCRSMKRIFLGVLITFLCCQAALAEKTIISEFDGADWQGWTEGKKYNFLSGFLLGSSYIVKKNEPFMQKDEQKSQFDQIRNRLSLREEKKKKKQPITFTREEVILWGHYRASMIQRGLVDYGVYGITVSQLAKGMDGLYQDPRNRKIKIADAIYTVKKQIEGASPAEIDSSLEFLRGE
jgi:hypothetical protein